MFTGVHVVQRCLQRALVLSTALVLLGVLVAPPMAFGISMSPSDPDELISTDDPYLYLLIAAVAASICALVVAWWVYWLPPSRRRTQVTLVLAAVAACSAGAIVGVAAFDLVALALG